jgi:hypothetical protein
MGKYLDIARKFEARRQEQAPPVPVPRLRLIPKPEAKRRPFLPRPLGHEDAVDPFLAWEGLFHWLIEYHPEHFYAVCDAEDAIGALEAQGVTNGTDYEAACQELLRRFERARRLKLSQGFKLWT